MILALDQGTTGSTALLINGDGRIAARAYSEFTQHFPRPGWVEHDAAEIWEVTLRVAREAIAVGGIAAADVAAIGITNQRETVVAWDPATGEPLAPAIVWQDRRTAARCAELKSEGFEAVARVKCGLTVDPYFSGTKIEWLIQNVPEVRDRAIFGTIDSWLAFKLTGRHVTDYSNAARTLLFDIRELRWDEQLCATLGVDPARLPAPVPSSGVIGETPAELLGAPIPVAGIAGDQQAALFGQICHRPGLAKNTYGTGSFVLLNVGQSAPQPAGGLLTTVAWGLDGAATYALEASVFIAGAAVQWLRDGLGLIESARETEELARSLDSNDGVYFVPALTGLGSPHWDPHARGAIFGLTRGTTRAHLVRAALEAIAYQTVDAVDAMQAATGLRLEALHADGGATANAWLMQFQADTLGVPVVVPEVTETTALGAGLLAGIAVGRWRMGELDDVWHEAERFEPRMEGAKREALLAQWRRSLSSTRERGEPGDGSPA
jgi:glycerol kinase